MARRLRRVTRDSVQEFGHHQFDIGRRRPRVERHFVTQRFIAAPSGSRRLVTALFVPVLVSLSLWVVCVRYESAAAAALPGGPREVARVTFAVAGDVIPHHAVMQAAAAQAT